MNFLINVSTKWFNDKNLKVKFYIFVKNHLLKKNFAQKFLFSWFYNTTMKIGLSMLKYPIAAAALTGLFATTIPANGANLERSPATDTFATNDVPPAGTQDSTILANAPSPEVTVKGEIKNATIVVDLTHNVLYKYDKNGKPEIAYSICSGKKSSPTDPGLRVVSHVEVSPFSTAPKTTKRSRNPIAYGPRIIILNVLDPVTGKQSKIGEFIHGNNDENSIGFYESLGCMRMDNKVIVTLSGMVKRGDIVNILPNKNL